MEYVIGAFLLFIVIIIAKGVVIVQQSQQIIVENLGTYHRTLGPGLKIIIPFLQAARPCYWVTNGIIHMSTRIDIREAVLDIPEQNVITRDNVSILIDAIMYVQITDTKKALYEVANLPAAVSQLAQTSLRSLIGEMELDQTLSSRDHINSKLKTILDEATDKWGLKVNRVELRNIQPPKDIQEAMEKQMQAERNRRAAVLEAQGDKEARVARSEGMMQEKINYAEGEKEAQIRNAVGEANAIKAIAEAQATAIQQIIDKAGTPQLAIQYLTAINYLEKFGKFTQGEGDKVYIPYEATATLASLGSIKDLFQSK
ncbi:MAG: hypothetical protein COA79_14635 [Planctomycetota bacterium]|nr:MAG: hypothetical protein COA79_14635 [Planctomycetota bacterium]